MEDLHDDARFTSLVHANWISDDGAYVMAGVPGDPISGDFGSIMLLGGTGAGNQHNQDRIDPVSPAEGFLTYTTGTGYAAVRYEHPTSGGKLVYCAFGIEGVPYPAISETYTDRVELLEAILKWFDPTYEIAENALPERFALSAYPNPFNSAVTIAINAPVETGHDPSLQIEIFDINGRMVETLAPLIKGGAERSEAGGYSPLKRGVAPTLASAGTATGCVFVWTPDASLGSGVYFLRVNDGDETATKPILYIK